MKDFQPQFQFKFSFKFVIFVFSAMITFALLFPQNGFCANKNWYVSTEGDDGDDGTGSETAPFATIQKGIDKAPDGDTVIVADGTYNESGLSFEGKAIVVKSASGNPEKCIVGNDANTVFLFVSGEYSSSLLSGFTIRDGKANEGGGIKIKSSGTRATSPTIENCIIRDNEAIRHILTQGKGGGVFVSSDLDGKYSRPKFINCRFIGNYCGYDDDGGAVFIADRGMASFRNCLFTGNYIKGAVSRGSVARIVGSTATVMMLNCTVVNNITNSGQHTISANKAGLASTYVNCIIRNPGVNGKEIDHNGGLVSHAPIVRNCNIYNIEQKSYDYDDHYCSPKDNHDLDPSFVGAGDYHLSMDSPDINFGIAGTSDDLDGYLRPYFLSNFWDVGAYEFNFAYLVENGINENTSGAWEANYDLRQWKTLTIGTTSSGVVDTAVIPGETFQTRKIHFYKLSSSVEYGMLRIQTSDSSSEYADTYGYLIDASQCKAKNFGVIQQDDNSGDNGNFKIDYPALNGESTSYYLAVKGKNTNPYDLNIWIQTDSEGNMCSNAVEDTSNYKFNTTYFDSSYNGLKVPLVQNASKIDFEDDIDVFKIEFDKPGTLKITGFSEELLVVLKDENCEKIETDIHYGSDYIIADIYDNAYCYLEIKTKDGVGSKTYNLSLDLYPPDYWYDVISGVIADKNWSQNGIMTKGGLAYDSLNGEFIVEGNGNGLDDDERDQCYFVYKKATGDFTLTANLKELNTTESTSYEELAGLMIREDLSVGAKNVFAGFTPNETTAKAYGDFTFKYRAIKDANGETGTIAADKYHSPTGNDNPNLRIKREGGKYSSSYYDTDISDWVDDSGDYLKMLEGVGNIIGSKAMIGMAVTSYNTVPDYMFIEDGPAISTIDPSSSTKQYYQCRIDHTSGLVNRPWVTRVNYPGYETYSFKNAASFSTQGILTPDEYEAAVNKYLIATNGNRPRLYKKSGIKYTGYEARRTFKNAGDLIANLPRIRFVKREGLSSSGDPVYIFGCLKDHLASDTASENNKPKIYMVRWAGLDAVGKCRIYSCIKENGPDTAAKVQLPEFEGENDYWQYEKQYAKVYNECDGLLGDDEDTFPTYSSDVNYAPSVQRDSEGEIIWQAVKYDPDPEPELDYHMWQSGTLYGCNYLNSWNEVDWDNEYEDLSGYYSDDDSDNLTQISGVTAEQSSTYTDPDTEDTRPASVAIDGETEGDAESKVSHTEEDTEAWLQIDLKVNYDIHEIKIYNRTDGSQNRLDDFYLFITKDKLLAAEATDNPDLATLLAKKDDELWHSDMQDTFTGSKSFSVNNFSGYNGCYVIVRLSGKNFLHMAEVEVIGYKENTSSFVIGKSWDYWRLADVDSFWTDDNDDTIPLYHTWELGEKYGTFWKNYWKKVGGDLEIIKELPSTKKWDENFDYETSQSTKASFNSVTLDTKDIELGATGETGAITVRPNQITSDFDIFEFEVTETGKITIETTDCQADERSEIKVYNCLGEMLNVYGTRTSGTGNFVVNQVNVAGSGDPVDFIVSSGTYYAKVFSPEGDIFEYGLRVNCDTGIGDDHGDYKEIATILKKWDPDKLPLLYFVEEAGNISDINDKDYFRFDVPANSEYPNGGYIRIMADLAVSLSTALKARLFDSAGNEIAAKSDIRTANPDYPVNYKPALIKHLNAGSYYIELSASVAVNYELAVDFDDYGDSYDANPKPFTGYNIIKGHFETVARTSTLGNADKDVFEIIVSSPSEYTFKTTGNSDSYCTLMDSDGSIITSAGKDGEGNNFSLTNNLGSGKYYLEVKAEDGKTGDYSLYIGLNDDYINDWRRCELQGGSFGGSTRWTCVSPAMGNLNAGATAPGVIEIPGDIDYFKYDTGQDQNGRLTIQSTGKLDAMASFYEYDLAKKTVRRLAWNSDGAGREADGKDYGNFKIQYDVKKNTTYLLYVKSQFAQDTGTYGLRVGFADKDDATNDDEGNNYAYAFLIDSTTAFSSVICGDDCSGFAYDGGIDLAGDKDYYRFDVTGSGKLKVWTTGTIDTYGYLYLAVGADSDGNGGMYEFLASNDDDPGSLIKNDGNFAINYYIDGKDAYAENKTCVYVKVKGFTDSVIGAYVLNYSFDTSVEDLHGDNCVTAMNVGPDYDSAGLKIDIPGDTDFFKFVAGPVSTETRGSLTVDTETPEGSSLDLFAYLKNYMCSTVLMDDNSGEGDNLSLEWSQQTENPEVFFVGVRDYEDLNLGEYTFNLKSNGTFMDFGVERNWQAENSNIHYFGFDLPETASTLNLTCTGSAADTEFKLLSGDSGIDTEVPFTINSDQTNNFTIKNADIEPGTYYLKIRPGSAINLALKADRWDWTQSAFTGGSGAGSFNARHRLPNSTQFDMTASGVDIWAESDSGYFAYRTLTGDFEISAKVSILGLPRNSETEAGWAKAGVMVRQTIANDSVNLFAAYANTHGSASQYRESPGGVTLSISDDDELNSYVKIIRKDNKITLYKSRDGHEWLTTRSKTFTSEWLSGEVLVGFAASSHEAEVLREFSFEDIVFTTNISLF